MYKPVFELFIPCKFFSMKKYFSEFELIDEGGFWETDDEKVLQQKFADYEAALNRLENILKSMERIPGESAESLAERISKKVKDEMGDWQVSVKSIENKQ